MSESLCAPWVYEGVEVRDERAAYGVVKDAHGRVLFDTINADVAEIYTEYDEGRSFRWDGVAERNLTLAAAAPDLLAACEDAEQVLRCMGEAEWYSTGRYAAARRRLAAAIAKAKGGAP